MGREVGAEKMRVGLIDVDSHNFPNLALMKISAYHKAKGDDVEMWNGLLHYDLAYQSKVFSDLYSKDNEFCVNADEVIKGGTGYGLNNKLPEEIEHQMPDYGLYGISDTAYGFLSRGCPRSCPFCIVSEKEGRKSRKVADLSEFWQGQENIKLLDPNILACKERENLLVQLADSRAYVDFTQGIDARLLTRDTVELINRVRLKNIHFAWDMPDGETEVLRGLRLWADHTTHKPKGKFGGVYVLTNYNTDHRYDLYRVETLDALGFDPYVMIYNKPTAPEETRMLARWCNNKIIFNSCSFVNYDRRIG